MKDVILKLAKFCGEAKTFDDSSPLLKSLYDSLKDSENIDRLHFGIASTAGLDRDNEVLVPKGVNTFDFMKNPVMLQIHDYRNVPVAKVVKLATDDKDVAMAFEFAETEKGQEYEYLYKNEFMSAFSVGFIPRSFFRVDDNTPDKIDIEVDEEKAADKKTVLVKAYKFSVDLNNYARRPRAFITKWELLEISPVPVPSNPEALIERGLIQKFSDNPKQRELARKFIMNELSEAFQEVKTRIESLDQEGKDPVFSGVVKATAAPFSDSADWSAVDARVSLAKWASADGKGTKETIDFSEYAKGFAIYSSEDPTKLIEYKFCHHLVEDGELKTSIMGVRAAMAKLLSMKARDESHLQAYKHLSTHYAEFGEDAPQFDIDHPEEDIEKIAKGEYEILAVRQSGVTNNHAHPYDDERSGRTGTVNGHSHPYTLGATRTGPGGNGHTHALAPTQAGVNEGDNQDPNGEQSGKDLRIRIDTLEESLEIKLNMISDTLEELAERQIAPAYMDPKDTGKGDGVNGEGDSSQALDKATKWLDELLKDEASSNMS